jgi:recombinational DNA repair protein RecT
MSNLQKIPIAKQIAEAGTRFVELPEVADRFQKLYLTMNGGNATLAKTKYEAEKFHFAKLLEEKPILKKCTPLSLYGTFLDGAVSGLSFDPAMKHMSIVPFNNKVKGPNGREEWESRATLMISGPGELVIRQNQGQIKHADNPILVFSGDHFVHGTKNGTVYLEHTAKFPREKDADLIAGYIRLERNDGSYDYKVMSIDQLMRLRAFSKDPDSLAWTKGLHGMFETKLIKHAFRSYPKLKIGNFTKMVSEDDEDKAPAIDYGIESEEVSSPPIKPEVKQDPKAPVKKQANTSHIPDAEEVKEETWDQGPDKPPASTVTYEGDDF